MTTFYEFADKDDLLNTLEDMAASNEVLAGKSKQKTVGNLLQQSANTIRNIAIMLKNSNITAMRMPDTFTLVETVDPELTRAACDPDVIDVVATRKEGEN